MKCFRFMLALCVSCICCASWAFAHPADGYAPKQVPDPSTPVMTSPITGTFGDLTFGSCQLTYGDLSPAELYIVKGASGSSYGTGGQLLPWYHEIFMIANAIHSQTGELPQALSIENISQASAGKGADVSRLEHFKSPITNEFPRLDAKEFAPGQVYIRLLTEAEMRQFAEMVPEYQQAWFAGVVANPDTCEVLDYVRLISPVYYVRVYGEHGVLVETIEFMMSGR